MELLNNPVHIYLQGMNALLPLEITDEYITYWVGAETTQIKVKDHRQGPVSAANRVFLGEDDINFSEIFNQSAKAKISYFDETEKLEIDLFEEKKFGDYPILWMGILEENTIPAYSVVWEIYKPLPDDHTAFAILIP